MGKRQVEPKIHLIACISLIWRVLNGDTPPRKIVRTKLSRRASKGEANSMDDGRKHDFRLRFPARVVMGPLMIIERIDWKSLRRFR